MWTNLLVDVNNFVFSMRHAKIKNPTSSRKKEKNVTEFLFRECVNSILRHSKELRVDAIVLCCDSQNVWRKKIYPEYKANHDDSDEDIYYKDVIAAADMLCEFMRSYTAAYVIAHPHSEADDVIAVWCQESSGVKNVIMSTDRDFIQLINENTLLYTPTKGEFRTTEDAGYDLFVKCIRGDKGDNIRSAFPRVREDKLKAAWNDDLSMLNLLETIRPDGIKVGDALSHNIALIDLTQQPDDIRRGIIRTINTAKSATYNNFKAMRYFGEIGLKDSVDILDHREKVFKKEPVFCLNK